MKSFSRGLTLAPALVLAACSSWFESDEKAPPCPRAAIVEGADQVRRYAGEGRTRDDVAFEARILGVTGECEVDDEAREVTIDMALRIAAGRGKALKGKQAPLSYFVAIVDPDGKVLAREEFATEIPLGGGNLRAVILEELQPVIPLPEGRRAASYTVFVGLVVTEEELDFNRRH
jgi:hypothetical protein